MKENDWTSNPESITSLCFMLILSYDNSKSLFKTLFPNHQWFLHKHTCFYINTQGSEGISTKAAFFDQYGILKRISLATKAKKQYTQPQFQSCQNESTESEHYVGQAIVTHHQNNSVCNLWAMVKNESTC